ncbi:MAG: energy transducer TonB [Bacteroidales bacterium]|nr:energy transducer TonB [Bacteroidales bacterium]
MNEIFRIISILILTSVATSVLCQNDSSDSHIIEIGWTVVEEQPSFPGGFDSLQKYLLLKTKPPNNWRFDSISGKVYVEFLVESNGSISKSKILRGLNPILDSIAICAIRTMPKWDPAKQRGKPIDCKFLLPIKFGVQSNIKRKK